MLTTGSLGKWQHAELHPGDDSTMCTSWSSNRMATFASRIPRIYMYKKRRVRTLETGVETGSKAKWLIRRSCKCVPCRLLVISFNFSISACSFPDSTFVVGASRLTAGSISSFVEAKRTAGDPSAAFLGSVWETVLCSDPVEESWSENTAISQRRGRNAAELKHQNSKH